MSAFRLDAGQVEETFRDCMGDGSDGEIEIDAIAFTARLDPAKLAEHGELITAMLLELPEQFRESGGGGWSFLQACEDRHGRQWTDLHQTMAMLFALGEGLGIVKLLLPREMWIALPGGVPYYVILDQVN